MYLRSLKEEVHLECTETENSEDVSINNCLHSIGPNSVSWNHHHHPHHYQSVGTCPGPELGEITSHLEENIT